MNTTKDERLLGMDRVAEMLAISRRQVYRMIADEELPAPLKLGRKSMFLRSDVENFLQHLKAQRAT